MNTLSARGVTRHYDARVGVSAADGRDRPVLQALLRCCRPWRLHGGVTAWLTRAEEVSCTRGNQGWNGRHGGSGKARSLRASMKRMDDRDFTEIDLREMLEQAQGYGPDVVVGRWVIATRHRRRRWEVIVEPDAEARLLVVVTA